MTWTRETPTKPGYYWLRLRRDIHSDDVFGPAIVNIYGSDDPELEWMGYENPMRVADIPGAGWIDACWYGPLEPPPGEQP